MADPVTLPDDPVATGVANEGEDVEMAGAIAGATEDDARVGNTELPGDVADEPPQRISFLEYVTTVLTIFDVYRSTTRTSPLTMGSSVPSYRAVHS